MIRAQRSGWQPAAPPQRPVLLINPRSGDGRAARAALAEHAREQGIEAVVLTPEQSLATLVRDAVASGADALGMAGGDGSLAVVASAALARGIPFVCVPAGTRNHFALDLGIDRRDVVGALGAFTDGVERRIDVATVNGRLFLNNVSLGLYGDAVQQPGYRDAKARTLLATAGAVLGSKVAAPSLRVVGDREDGHGRPAVVLVSNNPYALEPPPVAATRPRLDGGAARDHRARRARGRSPPPARAWSAPTLEVRAAARAQAGLDGEAVELDPVLRFEIRPGGPAGADLVASSRRLAVRTPGVQGGGR